MTRSTVPVPPGPDTGTIRFAWAASVALWNVAESFDGEGGVHDDLPMAAAIIMWYAEHILAHEMELPTGGNGTKKGAFNPATYGLS